MIIDSHQHFWRLETGFYGWIPDKDAVLKRNFEPAELAPQLRQAGVDGTVLVQAANTEDELTELSAHAVASGFVRGIVTPLELDPPGVATRIAAMARVPLVVGIRPPFAALFDGAQGLTQAAEAALGAMESHGLVFDCLAVGSALGLIPALAARHSGMSFVVNHGGNPDLGSGRVNPEWRRHMQVCAREPNVVCKLSGMLTRLPPGADQSIVAEHAAILCELFGPTRLLWGSDWPVLTKASSYLDWLDFAQHLLAALSQDERAAVFGGNAARVYNLGARDHVAA